MYLGTSQMNGNSLFKHLENASSKKCKYIWRGRWESSRF